MKLIELYRRAIEIGIQHDPRNLEEIKDVVEKYRKEYESLSEKEKEFFDTWFLEHPYADSRILFGDEQTEVSSALVGIDIDTAELLLADRLREKGKRIDLIISHHPSARAWAQFYEVMDMQTSILESLGVNPVVAEKLLCERKGEVKRRVMPANHHKALACARLLNLPWVCLHTPADNCVYNYLLRYFSRHSYKTVGDIIDLLYEIPEYREGARRGIPPVILLGNKSSRAGKVALEMTGGTEPSVENYQFLAASGIGTIIGMHFSEQHYKKAKEAKLNLVVAGHMSSDTLGMNLLLDQIETSLGAIDVIEVAGFYRVRHTEN